MGCDVPGIAGGAGAGAGWKPGGMNRCGAIPGGTIPGNRCGATPGGTIPGGMNCCGTIPGRAIPGGMNPAGPICSGTVPGGMNPAGPIFSGTVPGATIRGGIMSGGTIPSGGPGCGTPGRKPGGSAPDTGPADRGAPVISASRCRLFAASAGGSAPLPASFRRPEPAFFLTPGKTSLQYCSISAVGHN